jgi:hypothetical protein
LLAWLESDVGLDRAGKLLSLVVRNWSTGPPPCNGAPLILRGSPADPHHAYRGVDPGARGAMLPASTFQHWAKTTGSSLPPRASNVLRYVFTYSLRSERLTTLVIQSGLATSPGPATRTKKNRRALPRGETSPQIPRVKPTWLLFSPVSLRYTLFSAHGPGSLAPTANSASLVT